jgi:hypothetical protein
MSFFIPSDYGPPFGTDFIPNLQYIANITQAQQAVVTFTANHNFTLWEWISFRVPPQNGMIQLNNQKALIVALTPNTVTIDLDTLFFYPFIFTSENQQIPCVAVPAGSGIVEGQPTTTLEDAFDNRPVI